MQHVNTTVHLMDKTDTVMAPVRDNNCKIADLQHFVQNVFLL